MSCIMDLFSLQIVLVWAYGLARRAEITWCCGEAAGLTTFAAAAAAAAAALLLHFYFPLAC
jgi:hypothetical protein